MVNVFVKWPDSSKLIETIHSSTRTHTILKDLNYEFVHSPIFFLYFKSPIEKLHRYFVLILKCQTREWKSQTPCFVVCCSKNWTSKLAGKISSSRAPEFFLHVLRWPRSQNLKKMHKLNDPTNFILRTIK